MIAAFGIGAVIRATLLPRNGLRLIRPISTLLANGRANVINTREYSFAHRQNGMISQQTLSASRLIKMKLFRQSQRSFHNHTPLYKSNREFGNSPKIRIFRISPFLMIGATIASFSLFALLVPVLVTLFIPLTISFIGFLQFKKWRQKQMINKWMQGLENTHLRTKYTTLNMLRLQTFDELLSSGIRQEGNNGNDAINKLFTDIRGSPLWPSNNNFNENTNKFKRFVEARVNEAISKDDNGIRSSMLDKSYQDDLKSSDGSPIKIEFRKFRASNVIRDGKQINEITYPLFADIANKPPMLIGEVSVVSMNPNPMLKSPDVFNMINENPDTKLKLIITVNKINKVVPEIFIIDSAGETGEFFSRFDAKPTKDGHTEYTIKR